MMAFHSTVSKAFSKSILMIILGGAGGRELNFNGMRNFLGSNKFMDHLFKTIGQNFLNNFITDIAERDWAEVRGKKRIFFF